MDPHVKLVIEGACVGGTALLAATTTPLLAGKPRNPSMLLPWAGGLAFLLLYAFINPKGGPDPFPVVVGGCTFVSVVVGLIAALTLSWRWFHRGGHAQITAKTERDFGYMALFGLGSTVSMAALSGLLGWPLARFGTHHLVARCVSLTVGCTSMVLGIKALYMVAAGLFRPSQ